VLAEGLEFIKSYKPSLGRTFLVEMDPIQVYQHMGKSSGHTHTKVFGIEITPLLQNRDLETLHQHPLAQERPFLRVMLYPFYIKTQRIFHSMEKRLFARISLVPTEIDI
jgi:hypothetical protein